MGRRPVYLPATKVNPEKKPYIPSLAYLEVRIDPDEITPVRSHVTLGKKAFLPVDKTEAEIDRLWEYNSMMGRGI